MKTPRLRWNNICRRFLLVLACLYILFFVISGERSFAGYSHSELSIEITAGQLQSNAPRPANCEDVLLYLDQAVSKVRETKDNSYLIVIGRLGTGEKGYDLNQARLKAIKKYLERFSALQYLTAEGDRTKNLGQIEIYVRGRLLQVIHIRKNAKYFCKEPIG